MLKNIILLSSLIFALTTSTFAQVTYKIDNGHSNVNFAIQWREISFRTGEFKSFGGEVVTQDENSLQDAKVTLTVQVGSIDVIAENLNKMLQKKEYLDSASCPQIFFTCDKVKKKKKNLYEAEGDLTIRCKTVKAKFLIEDNGRKEKYAAIKVTAALSKKDFDITGGGDRLGDLINITAFFEMVKIEKK